MRYEYYKETMKLILIATLLLITTPLYANDWDVSKKQKWSQEFGTHLSFNPILAQVFNTPRSMRSFVRCILDTFQETWTEKDFEYHIMSNFPYQYTGTPIQKEAIAEELREVSRVCTGIILKEREMT